MTEQTAIATTKTTPTQVPSESTGEAPHDGLTDDQGPIPMFPPRKFDELGRLIPISLEERRARSEAAIRALDALAKLPDDDPPGTAEAFMRGVDANRAPGCKLFEGMY